MSDFERVNNIERYVWENKLLTMKGGEFFGTKVKNIFLIGLISATKMQQEENVEGIQGQVLIISSNPIYLDGKSWHLQSNMIHMDKLPLTKTQRSALLKGSIYAGGLVSVYVGQFLVEECVALGRCGLLNSSSLNILRLLCGNNCLYRVEVDMGRVIPLSDEQLNDIIMVKMEEAFGQHDDIGGEEGTSSCCCSSRNSSSTWSCAESEGISEKTSSSENGHGVLVGELKGGENENFRFWKVDSNLLLVELICPKKHWGYQVNVEFLETLVSEPNVEDPIHGPQITRVLVRDKVNIKSTMKQVLTRKSGKFYVNEGTEKASSLPLQLVSEAVMLLPIPDYSNEQDQSLLDAWKVCEIVHFCKLRLVRNTNPNRIGPKTSATEATASIGRKKVLRRSNTFPPAAIPRVHSAPQAAPDTAPLSPLYVINAQAVTESMAHSYIQCCFPVKLTLIKADFPDERKHQNGESCDTEINWKKSGGESAFSASGKHATHGDRCGSKTKRRDCFSFWRFPRSNK